MFLKNIFNRLDDKYKDSSFVLQKKVYVLFWLILILLGILSIVIVLIFIFFDFDIQISVILTIDIIGMLVLLCSIFILLEGKYYLATNILSTYFIIFLTVGSIARMQSTAETGTNNFTYITFAVLGFCGFFNSRKFLLTAMIYLFFLNLASYLVPALLLDISTTKSNIVSSIINSNSSIIIVASLSYLISSITDKALNITEKELAKNKELNITLEKKVHERTKKLAEANKKLKELSLIDPLTGLRNRRFIYEVVTELSENFINNKNSILKYGNKRDNNLKGKVLGVYLIDLDYFKKINDTYGHKAGDSALITLAQTIKKSVRGDDITVRWGGEEFLIILNQTRHDYFLEFPKKIKDAIENLSIKLPNDKIIHKTCSVGCAAIPISEKHPTLFSLEDVINMSDFGLYQAKENGRNKIVFVNVKEPDIMTPEKKEYLTSISRDSKMNADYISISFL